MATFRHTAFDRAVGTVQFALAGFMLLFALVPLVAPMGPGWLGAYTIAALASAVVSVVAGAALRSGGRLSILLAGALELADGVSSALPGWGGTICCMISCVPLGAFMVARAAGFFQWGD